MKLFLALLLVAAVSCGKIPEQKYPTIPQPVPQQPQQTQYYVPQYQPQTHYIPSPYLPPLVRHDSLDRDQMCEKILEQSHQVLYNLFGMKINPIDFSFLQCMHKTELVELQKLMDALKTLDLNFMALQIPGFQDVPRLPILSCMGAQIFWDIEQELAKRPEHDKDWPLPPSCGRYDGKLNVQQCAALMDRVIPTLVIPGIPPKTIPWTDVSFLEKMGDEELCYLKGASSDQLQEAREDTLLWDIIEIDPLQRLLPAFKCYLKYLVENIDKKIESRASEKKSPEAYCESVTDLLVADVLDEVSGDRQAEQHERRSLDAEKRGYYVNRRYCRPWYKSCNSYNNVKLRIKVKVGIKNTITNIGSHGNYNYIGNNVGVYTST